MQRSQLTLLNLSFLTQDEERQGEAMHWTLPLLQFSSPTEETSASTEGQAQSKPNACVLKWWRTSYSRPLQVPLLLLDYKLSQSGIFNGMRQTFAEKKISFMLTKYNKFKINTKHFALCLKYSNLSYFLSQHRGRASQFPNPCFQKYACPVLQLTTWTCWFPLTVWYQYFQNAGSILFPQRISWVTWTS